MLHNLVDALKASAAAYPEHRAIVFAGRTTSHGEFYTLTDRAAAGLARAGIRPGDRIGLYAVNSDTFAAAYFGILKAGATVVPINLLLNPKEVAYILNDAGVSGLIYSDPFGDAVREIRALLPVETTIWRIGSSPIDPADGDWNDLIAADEPPPALTLDPDNDLAAIIYTSGTTGYPKGAMLTHRNLASNANSISVALRLEPGHDVLLVVLPMFHAFAATVGMIFPLLNGCTLIPVPKFDPQLIADTVQSEGVTILPAVPSMYNVLLRLPESEVAKFASLKFCISGGAALPAEVMRQFEQKFGKFIYEGDGPTECSPCTCVNPIGGERKIGSVGRVIPDVEMKIMDDEGRELPDGEIGEICVRGPNVMKGYWKRPDDTRDSFWGEWFKTGDLGYVDQDAYFYIVDRKKDMIIVNGMNVYPRVIEEVLFKHPAIKEAAVVGQPDALHGERAVAHVVVKEGATLTEAGLRQYCREHLGRHEIPRTVRFMDALPRNAAGKVLKRELRVAGEQERGVDHRD
ncbi:MAG TPA: long-chain fatty acid--CoA ligase [Kiritimatiellia bacterium]|nr:long-chain fatty acid--CoA ligase [Kiritimatiellia bacterium]HMO99078.1 long-chain fatty acid--CoA ligase [Kiritimatiellia bacterium]HMP96608.1 long-chain fatty acid--CoA ligase [Kiritimatiellia bacterium]